MDAPGREFEFPRQISLQEVVRREVDIEASPEEVWEALSSEEGRERWLEHDSDLDILIELADEPKRLVWRWGYEGEESTRVEFVLVATPIGSRVIVTETAPEIHSTPTLSLEMLACSLTLVTA